VISSLLIKTLKSLFSVMSFHFGLIWSVDFSRFVVKFVIASRREDLWVGGTFSVGL
jgi:hypothetical protein